MSKTILPPDLLNSTPNAHYVAGEANHGDRWAHAPDFSHKIGSLLALEAGAVVWGEALEGFTVTSPFSPRVQ